MAIEYIKANIGHCAGVDGCQLAPTAIINATPSIRDKVSHSITPIDENRGADAVISLTDFSHNLSLAVQDVLKSKKLPIVLGGDHSCGIGTWSGAVTQGEDFGLLWVDAHLDMHTLETSDSKNMHGMPVATLLGYGENSLINIRYDGAKIKPENMAFIGIRCFESPEQKLAESLGCTIYYVDEVHEHGFAQCFANVIEGFQHKGIPFGISFDMDSLDVSEMTSLGTPVENGLVLKDVLSAFKSQDLTGLRALEVVEYNPSLDKTGDDIVPVQKVLACFDTDIKI